MAPFDMEIGKLTAQIENLHIQLSDLKKNMESNNKQLRTIHTEFLSFSAKWAEEMEKRFITRIELAPIKSVLSMAVLTTVSALCLGFVQLFFNTQ